MTSKIFAYSNYASDYTINVKNQNL